jgi:hypothetical protein
MFRRFLILALPAVLVPVLSLSVAQTPGPFNERDVKQRTNVLDKQGVWVLDFRFKDPRLITVDIPGRGRRIVWYLWYQVINYTGEPRNFIPDFELVTLDRPAVFHDQVLPKVQDAIARIEDPTGFLDIKNSVTIASQTIPLSKPDAAPRAITGVAMWDDVDPASNRFSIFVSGLSNGWTVDDSGKVRRKTLQLNFRRLGDQFKMDAREIRFVPPAEWLYRASTFTLPGAKPQEENAAPKPPAAEAKPAPDLQPQ